MKRFDRRGKNTVFVICVLTIFLSAPVFTDYLPASERLGIFFLEKEGVRGPFLWLPFWLHNLGMNIRDCCRIYITAVNFAAVAGSCYCFTKISGNVYAGMAGSFCYSLSMYSVYIRYVEGSLGGITAFAFLPFVLYGMWRLYAGEAGEKNVVYGAFPLGVGIFGLFASHIPTAVITLGFVAAAALLLFRRTFRKNTLIGLVAALFSGCLASSFCWLPYWRGMLLHASYGDPAAGADFAERSMTLPQLLVPFAIRYGRLEKTSDITQYCGLELPLTGAVAAWILIILLKKGRDRSREKRTAVFLICLSGAAVFMSTSLMPWNVVQGLHWLPRVILEHVAYPRRFILIAVLLLSAAVSLLGKLIWERGKKATAYFLLAVTVANILSGVYMEDAHMLLTPKAVDYRAKQSYQESEYVFYLGE